MTDNKQMQHTIDHKFHFSFSRIVIVLLCILSFNATAQPVLIGLEENPEIKNFVKEPVRLKNKSLAHTTLFTLPFFDDFSTSRVYPDSARWSDKFAFVNSTLPYLPLSIGVATLDAVSFDGSMYTNAGPSAFIADYLTSVPIDLKIPAPKDTTIYLSFWYQPQGIGDSPEPNDSLLLEFYAPDTVTGLLINEILARDTNSANTESWIEIYNATDSAKNIGGLFLSNDVHNQFKFKIPVNSPDSTSIAPYGHIVFHTDMNTAVSALHTNFELTNDSSWLGLSKPVNGTDTVRIYDNSGMRQIILDTVIIKGTLKAIRNGLDSMMVIADSPIKIFGNGVYFTYSNDTLQLTGVNACLIAGADSIHLFNFTDTIYYNTTSYNGISLGNSYGRYPDGSSTWKTSASATPGACNPPWQRVWFANGSEVQPFKNVMIKVTSQFQNKGFRFRFKNYASLSPNSQLTGRRSNVDYWHLDYVYLNFDRSPADTVINDVAFVYPGHSILKFGIESMPWSHFKLKYSEVNGGKHSRTYRNNDDVGHLVTRKSKVIDPQTGTQFEFGYGAINTDPYQFIYDTLNVGYGFPDKPGDSAVFIIRDTLHTDSYDSTFNNCLDYYQKFYNYYAYDDGSAECGIGIDGQQTSNARVAYKFNSYKADTLRAIQMYFNRTLNDANEVYFYPTIWADNNGVPGRILYKQESLRPAFSDSLNRFKTYFLDTTLVLSGIFYVGWTQTAEVMMNVGFDMNRYVKQTMFYNIYGTWETIDFEGALMIRPVFGKALYRPNNEPVNKSITVYPVPSKDKVYIDGAADMSMALFDSFGRRVFYSENSETSIDVSYLPNGIYYLVFNNNSKFRTGRKIVVIH